MKLRGIVAGAALWVCGCLGANGVRAESYIHLQHDDGRIGLWQLDALRLNATLIYEPPRAEEGETLKGVFDFDGDGDVDLVFENSDQGLSLWELESGNRVSQQKLGALSEGEHLLWVGAWNSGQGPDLLTIDKNRDLFRRRWDEGSGLSEPEFLISVGDVYRFVGASDLDEDGFSDLIAFHPAGKIEAWLRDDEALLRETVVWESDSELAEEWQIVGAAAFDENPGDDLVLQHLDGRIAVWPLVFPDFLDVIELTEAPEDAGWRVAVLDSGTNGRIETSPIGESEATSPQGMPQKASPPVQGGAISLGDPDASVSPVIDLWWRQHGVPFLELWVP